MHDSSSDPPDRPAVLATLVATTGSSPRTPGARMWVDETGAIAGAVTIGGCVDARVLEIAQEVLASGESRLLALELGEEDAVALGMTCAGGVELLVEPADPRSGDDPVRDALRRAAAEVAAGRRAAIVVPLDRPRHRMVVPESGVCEGSLGDAASDAIAAEAARAQFLTGRSQTVLLDGGPRVWIEVHAPPASLVIFGATQVAQPLAAMAAVLGLRVIVVDGRERWATRERFPAVDELIVGMPSAIADRLPLTASSLVVLLSHDYKYDLPVLRRVLASSAGYIGCLGSTRRGRAMLDFLAAEGVSPDALARVRIPVGLDIGARTPAEIALAVLAEGLAVTRARDGMSLRDRSLRG